MYACDIDGDREITDKDVEKLNLILIGGNV